MSAVPRVPKVRVECSSKNSLTRSSSSRQRLDVAFIVCIAFLFVVPRTRPDWLCLEALFGLASRLFWLMVLPAVHSHRGSAGQGGFDFGARSTRGGAASVTAPPKIFEKSLGPFFRASYATLARPPAGSRISSLPVHHLVI